MRTAADKVESAKSSVASAAAKTATGSVAAARPDRRPAAAAQRQLQADIAGSPRLRQAATLQRAIDSSARQQAAPAQLQKKMNKTGLPDELKAGVENLTGYSLDDVKVHYNSAKPAELQAHAYAQGTDIHVAPGQEEHLPHEAWHVVQQKQGRVRTTRQLKGQVAVNDDARLEKEADVMGAKAAHGHQTSGAKAQSATLKPAMPVQRTAVVQRREAAVIEGELDVQLAALNDIDLISEKSSAENIAAYQVLLAPFPPLIAALATEVAEKGGDAVTPLATLDDRVTAINVLEPQLAADIIAGEKAAPPKPVGAWGTGRGEYEVWKSTNESLATNQKTIGDIQQERNQLNAERPVSVLQSKLVRIKEKLSERQESLLAAQRECYFYLLMTTVTPTMTQYKDEGDWGSGPSVLGEFIFRGTGDIQGIPDRVGPIKVHIHFKKGSKQINRAHIKQEGWPYTILSPDGPSYANTALNACKSQINQVI